MSSTNRGYERHKTDYYVTPLSAVATFLDAFLGDVQQGEFIDDTTGIADKPDKMRWLDPCAGGDDFHEMSYPAAIKKAFDIGIDTLDIRNDSKAQIQTDYLTWDKGKNEYDIIITNPPFYLAQAIIEKALKDVRDGGYVVMLLRLNFFGSNERFPFWEKQLPILTYVHHRRFSFTDDKKTDSIEYMHAVWQKGNCPKFSMLKVI